MLLLLLLLPLMQLLARVRVVFISTSVEDKVFRMLLWLL